MKQVRGGQGRHAGGSPEPKSRVGALWSCARGCGSLPRTLITGRYAERPSPESSPLAAHGERAEAQRSRPERPALSKSAVGPARDCGPPGSDAPLAPRLTGLLCWGTLHRWRGVAGSFKSPPLRTAIRPAICASTRPCTRKCKRSVTADVLEKLLHTYVLECVVDVRDHALLLLPLPPAVA